MKKRIMLRKEDDLIYYKFEDSKKDMEYCDTYFGWKVYEKKRDLYLHYNISEKELDELLSLFSEEMEYDSRFDDQFNDYDD